MSEITSSTNPTPTGAPAPTGQGKQPVRSWFNVGVMALAHFMSDYYTAFLPVLLPIIANQYGISYSESAAIYMVFSVAMNFVQPPIGLVADQRNLNYIMPLSVLTGGVFASIIMLSPNLVTLLLIVLLCGFCSSGFHPVSASILTRVLPLKSKGFATSVYIAGGNLGFALAPVIVAGFIEQFGQNLLAMMALPAIFTTILIYIRHLQVPSPELLARASAAKAAKAAKKAGNAAFDTGSGEVSIGKLIRSKQFIVLNSAIAFRSWTYCSLVVFIPLLFSEKGYSSMEGATCLVVLLIGAVVGGLVGGALTDHFGPKKVTLGSFAIALVTGLIFMYYCDLSPLSMICLFLCGAGVYGSTPNAIVWAQRLMPNNAAFAASMMLGFTFGAGYVESVLTGFLGDFIGLQDALFYSILVTLAIAIVLIAIIKEPPKEDIEVHIEAAAAAVAANAANAANAAQADSAETVSAASAVEATGSVAPESSSSLPPEQAKSKN